MKSTQTGGEDAASPRFVADNMLGRLARWLRLMGYDTLYAREAEDAEIISLSISEDRIILTRDRQLTLRRGARAFYIPEIMLEKQLKLVSSKFGLHFREDSMRCGVCNGLLGVTDRQAVKGRVPDGVYQRNELFHECVSCGHVYWRGTHWTRIRAVIGRAEHA